ncbi:hypothetical protein ABIB51_002146 [Arthrobacter sp. UYCu712]
MPFRTELAAMYVFWDASMSAMSFAYQPFLAGPGLPEKRLCQPVQRDALPVGLGKAERGCLDGCGAHGCSPKAVW